MSVPNTLSTSKADIYCSKAIGRARTLYAPDSAVLARTACIQDVQEFDSNWIENASGVKDASSILNPLVDGYKSVESGDLALARKALASAYLIYKYVVSPSISDTENIKDDGARIFNLATKNRFSNERRRGRVENTCPVLATLARLTYTCTIHTSLRSEIFPQIWNALEKFGLDPSAGQVWDLIPYSFVVDWFLPLGDSLKYYCDYNSLVTNRNIKARIEGFKVCWDLEKETILDLFDGNIYSNGKPLEYSWYDRRIYNSIGSYDPLAISNPGGLSLSQATQGIALITQFKK